METKFIGMPRMQMLFDEVIHGKHIEGSISRGKEGTGDKPGNIQSVWDSKADGDSQKHAE